MENIQKIANDDEQKNAVEVRKYLSDDGKVNIDALPQEKMNYYLDIAKSLNDKDLMSVASYGSDLQNAMNTYSSDFLKQSFDSTSGIDSAALVSKLLGSLQEVDVDDLEESKIKKIMRRVPILKKLLMSVEQIKAKYNTIEKNIDGIVLKLEASRQLSLRDNNLLQKQFENNRDYIIQLEDLIIAGKLKSKELERTVEQMRSLPDQYTDYQISDMEEYKNALDKRLTDLIMLRYAFKQSLSQIRIIQRTNIMNATNIEQQITMTIPLWKNQLSLAVSLYDQKKVINISSQVADATNAIFKKNAEMMKTQSIEVAKQNQRSVIDIETLRQITKDLVATIEGVQKVQREGAQKRAAAEAEIRKLEQSMNQAAIGIAASAHHVIARELSKVSNE